MIALLAVAGFLYYRSTHSSKLTETDTIVLADFTNTTGDAVFDDTLKQALAIQLEQSPFLRIVAPAFAAKFPPSIGIKAPVTHDEASDASSTTRP